MSRTDANVLSVAQAARVAECDRHTFTNWLNQRPDFAAAVVIDVPGARPRISKPRLLRYLHGDIRVAS